MYTNKYGHKYEIPVSWHIAPVSESSYFITHVIEKKKVEESAVTAFNQCAASLWEAAEYYRILNVLCRYTDAWLSHLHNPHVFQSTAMSKIENQPEPWLKPRSKQAHSVQKKSFWFLCGVFIIKLQSDIILLCPYSNLSQTQVIVTTQHHTKLSLK